MFGPRPLVLGKAIVNAEMKVDLSIEANPANNECDSYLTLRVKQGSPKCRISERSLEFRWFFSSYCLRDFLEIGSRSNLLFSSLTSQPPIYIAKRRQNYWIVSRWFQETRTA